MVQLEIQSRSFMNASINKILNIILNIINKFLYRCPIFPIYRECITIKLTIFFQIGKEINNNNIRTWIHAKDVEALEKVLFEGEGHLLLKHASAHPKTRKFLESVPRLMVKYFLAFPYPIIIPI